jgi:NCAIR mutase (PurE)-related protein
MEQLAQLPFQDVGSALVDHHRALRQGIPEVIYGPGKSPDQIVTILESLLAQGPRALVTRLDDAASGEILRAVPDARYVDRARILVVDREPLERVPGVCVVSAGTSDLPVAEEVAVTAEILGNGVERIADAGVAGLHRVLNALQALRSARVIVVVAGMDGALPSVVGGLVSVPVIAVPTSVGYGAGFGGIAALMTMLNSCATGVSVVNIDNGFGAGVLASMINRGRHE